MQGHKSGEGARGRGGGGRTSPLLYIPVLGGVVLDFGVEETQSREAGEQKQNGRQLHVPAGAGQGAHERCLRQGMAGDIDSDDSRAGTTGGGWTATPPRIGLVVRAAAGVIAGRLDQELKVYALGWPIGGSPAGERAEEVLYGAGQDASGSVAILHRLRIIALGAVVGGQGDVEGHDQHVALPLAGDNIAELIEARRREVEGVEGVSLEGALPCPRDGRVSGEGGPGRLGGDGVADAAEDGGRQGIEGYHP